MRLVSTGRVWYLVAWDLERADWRTFRLDRIDAGAGLARGARFTPREPPGGFAAYVARAVGGRRERARQRAPRPARAARRGAGAGPGLGGRAGGGRRRKVTVSADTGEGVAALALLAGMDFTLREAPEAVASLREAARRLLRATRPARRPR